ncbi:Thioredoxin-like protein AAED1 [Hypsizygus marmoreus]|uniref:Thioredoxin-like protein AAED1 n=1 Tax=Hypsizygus marmoreus TaxID=39966 RepID=A0A369J1M4_HYPMA|nr:Thioredoxin-like protein AAED1 [Hypsizygus marmoreus]
MSPDPKTLPDAEALAEVAKLEVLDVNGEKIPFGSVFEKEKTIVVFIRHFFCGSCQAYVERLGAIPKEALEKANTRIVVIGCGEWNPIQSYAETTQFHGPIYADPSRALYHALGMNIESLATTPAGQQKRSYLTLGKFTNAMLSIWKGPLKNPSLIGKQGNISQLGGDFIFGPGQVCSLASRMLHTEDHMEVADLMKAAGVEI